MYTIPKFIRDIAAPVAVLGFGIGQMASIGCAVSLVPLTAQGYTLLAITLGWSAIALPGFAMTLLGWAVMWLDAVN